MTNFTRSLLAILMTATGAQAAVTVKVVGKTATQAILSYQASESSPCTILVSENASLSPLVHDVDPKLFGGSDRDSRFGSLNNGTQRVVVIGKRMAEKALDGLWYSRALQAYTKHYFKVQCGNDSASGTFDTTNIPIGNTWNDTLPVDPAQPGEYAWPSLTGVGTMIVDPQTGLSIRQYTSKSEPWMYGSQPSEQGDFCSPTPVADKDGVLGYNCHLHLALSWVNGTSGEIRRLGYTFVSAKDGPGGWKGVGCGTEGLFVPNEPDSFYCMTDDSQGNGVVILKVTYHGGHTSNSSNQGLPDCSGGVQPCLSAINLTPGPTGTLYQKWEQFEPRLHEANFKTMFGIGLSTIQQGILIGGMLRSGQDSYGWMYAYDPSINQVIGSINSYSTTRWCSIHSLDNVGDANFIRYIGNTLWGSATDPGHGPFVATLTSPLSPAADTVCPPNTFGATGVSCSVITVAGEPCHPNAGAEDEPIRPDKCGIPGAGYLQDAQPGDYLTVSLPGQYDNMRLIAKNGNQWTVQRANTGGWGLYSNMANGSPAGTLLQFECKGRGGSAMWAYRADPHGTNILGDLGGTGNHTNYRPSTQVEIESTLYRVRHGDFPSLINAPVQHVARLAPFAGVYGDDQFYVESHVTAPFNDQWTLDGYPLEGGNQDRNSAVAEKLSGSLYKYSSTAYGAKGKLPLHPMQLPTTAFCGTKVLQDISGPSSVISDQSQDAYRYCLAKNAGECRADSAVGDLYANCPNVDTPRCVFPGYGTNGYGIKDLCVGDTGSDTQGIGQVGIANEDSVGRYNRLLTHSFVRYRAPPTFWNSRYIPGGKFILFALPPHAEYGDAADQGFIAKLPPYEVDTTVRNDFLPIPFQVTPPAGLSVDNAVVQFGYSENGSPSAFFCTSRREACIKGVDAGYGYASDSIKGVACQNGCSLTIPAIPQRTVYFQVLFRDAGGHVIGRDAGHVAAAEPPYGVSEGGTVIGTLPAPELNLPRYVSLKGNIQASYPSGYDVTFDWTFTPASNVGGAGAVGRAGGAAVSLAGSGRTVTLARATLAPGDYTVTVVAKDATGAMSAPAQANITLIPGDYDAVRVFPNPWRIDLHNGKSVTFDHLTLGSHVKIFTVSGHHVRTLTDLQISGTNVSAVWDLKNESGDKVASGLYLYSITDDQDNKRRGKFAVIR